MGKFERKKRNRKPIGVWILIAGFAVLLFVGIIRYNGTKEEEPYNEDSYNVSETTSVNSPTHTDSTQSIDVIETENAMVIRTAYFEFELPSTFAEILDVSYTDYCDCFALEFYMKESPKNIPLYTIWIGQKKDVVLGMLNNGTDIDKIVSIEFHDMPKNLTGSSQETFFAAQETANDVTQAMNRYLIPIDADTLSGNGSSPEVEDDTKENNLPEESLPAEFQVVENRDTIDIITKYGKVSYPIAFEELLVVIPDISDAGYLLEFYCIIEETRIPVYTLGFGTSVGTEIGYIVCEQDGEVLVSIEYIEAPPDLIGDELDTFYAAQETANDVISSLNCKTQE